MKIEIEPYDALPCQARVFEINGISMNKDDFGTQESESDGEYGCNDNHFVAYDIKKIRINIDKQIKLTDEEILEVCEHLTRLFYVGGCGWCS